VTISYYEKMGGKVVNIDDEIPFELPESWAWCRGYSCFEGLGSTKPQGDFFDYIDIDAIDNRLHCIKDAKHLPVVLLISCYYQKLAGKINQDPPQKSRCQFF